MPGYLESVIYLFQSCSSSLLEWLDSNCFIVIVLAFTSGSFQVFDSIKFFLIEAMLLI